MRAASVYAEGSPKGDSSPAEDVQARLQEIASILATGYLRLLLGASYDTGASCGAHNPLDGSPLPINVLCRDDGNPDHPISRDPEPDHRPTPRRVRTALRTSYRLLESGMASTEGLLVGPGEGASGVRRRRRSDAGRGGPGSAAEPAAGCADSGAPGIGPRSTPPQARHRARPRLPRVATDGDRARAGI
jgi:hypothetical protein